MCPAGLRSDCSTGKEGFLTLAFQVIVSHTIMILGTTGEFYGTWNDKFISRHDDNFSKIRTGWYKSLEWHWVDCKGIQHTETGLYLFCDGGYQLWPIFMCPFKDQWSGPAYEAWSSHIESLQKDIECTFGILKKRFKNTDRNSGSFQAHILYPYKCHICLPVCMRDMGVCLE
jgi:hypothetical protein